MTTSAREVDYVLGHSAGELRRLMEQSDVFRDVTDAWLRGTGIPAGARVLDLGCGAGDVTMAVADLVGPLGHVVGIDRSDLALRLARERAAALGYDNVSFEQADVDSYEPPHPFDALVGRLVLMYQADAGATLARFRPYLTHGAMVCFQEMDMPAARSVPMAPLVSDMRGWILESFRRSGAPVDQGATLHRVYRRAGLPVPEIVVGQVINVHGVPAGCAQLTRVLQTLLPRTIAYGIATEKEIGIADLETRLGDQLRALDAVLYSPALVGASARVP
jgi:SAM-dependent methyltransferase